MQADFATKLEQQDTPQPPMEPECECQDTERCPVHFGYDD